jgi:hypothetical protein
MTTEAISHAVNDLGIHVIEINDGSRESMDAMLSILERMYAEPTTAKAIYILMDSTKYTLPLTPTIRQVIQLEQTYPNHPSLNIAVLLGLDIAIMVDTMLRPLRNKNQIRMFTPKDRERAMQWLMSRQAINMVKY